MTRPLHRSWKWRLLILAAGLLVGLLTLAGGLYRTQVLEYQEHSSRARLNTVVAEAVPAPRGKILDAHGHTLVSNTPRFALAVKPFETYHASAALRQVAAALGVPAPRLLARAANHARLSPAEPAVVLYSVSLPQLERLAPMLANMPQLQIVTRSTRRYPHQSEAAHVLGYVGEISDEELHALRSPQYATADLIGKGGLERTYDRALRGYKGVRLDYVNAVGRVVSQTAGSAPVPGLNLHLTLDAGLQEAAESALRNTLDELQQKNGEKSGGAAVVMSARTGAVLALVSLPNFDPRPFARGIRDSEYHALLADARVPLLDRVTQCAFPPGSTFKIINASASLQEHVCTPQSHFYCGGWYKGFHCFVQSGHGHLDFFNTIALSCDVVYYTLADRLGPWRLSRYARAFGLGSPTGIDLPAEDGGLLPDPLWKKRVFHDQWYEGETIVFGIGQGYLTVTPMQLAVATATVANGGRVLQPYLVDHMTTWTHRLLWKNQAKILRRVPVDPKYLAAVRTGMRGAVTHGTSTAADSQLVEVAGKTGTAEALATVNNPHARNHVWFTCFAPYQHPEIVVTVFVEKAGGFGGSVSAPVARQIIDYYYRARAVLPPPGGRGGST